MKPCLTHLAWQTRDLDKAIAFYGDYCGMNAVHSRGEGDNRIVWLSEPGREQTLIFVLIPGGNASPQAADDYGHLGFALESRAHVDQVAAKARADGVLAWPPKEDSFPVGYYCGVRDPDGRVIEFSYGQPLGPGAPTGP